MGFIGVGNRGGSLLRTALQVPGAIPMAIADVQPAHRNGRAKDTKAAMEKKLGDKNFQVEPYDEGEPPPSEEEGEVAPDSST